MEKKWKQQWEYLKKHKLAGDINEQEFIDYLEQILFPLIQVETQFEVIRSFRSEKKLSTV